MPNYRYAKIIATLGPASSDLATIRTLAQSGANVFRLNFSHGTHEEHRQRLDIIRQVEGELGHPLGILADLQGPKLRIGQLAAEHILLAEGDEITFDLSPEPGTRARVGLPHPEIFAAARPGVTLLIDDGKLRLEITAAQPERFTARTIVGGPLLARKGVSVVDAVLPLSPMTDKDRVDLAFALEIGVEWIALSFVQRAEDIDELRALVGPRAKIMAKIEKPSAIDCLEAIVDRADAVMVARGDLGVEMPPEAVPRLQRRILRICRAAGKPVVVATQMLESMITSPTPTRAEASDVATAIYAEADAVMLSAETASGRYPVQAVSIMARIIEDVEADPDHWSKIEDRQARAGGAQTISDVICASLRQAAKSLKLAAVVAYTTSGNTGLRAARERPHAPLLCLASSDKIARELCLVWGVRSRPVHNMTGLTEVIQETSRTILAEKLGEIGDLVAITAGQPFGISGTTNVLRIEQVML